MPDKLRQSPADPPADAPEPDALEFLEGAQGLARSANHRIVHRNPREGLAIGPHATQARELNMRCRDDVATLGRISESSVALDRRRLRIAVELNPDRGVVELDAGDVNQVAPDNELLSLALDHVRAVPRRVAASRHGLDTRAQLGLTVER